jgi:hypothetical protein
MIVIFGPEAIGVADIVKKLSDGKCHPEKKVIEVQTGHFTYGRTELIMCYLHSSKNL